MNSPTTGLLLTNGLADEKKKESSVKKKINTSLACLTMMARLHGVAADPDQLAHDTVANQSFDTTGSYFLLNALN